MERQMQFVYPVDLVADDGELTVSFPDVPEALTSGDNEADAMDAAADCLLVALGGYVEARRALPRPSRAKRGRRTVTLPPLAGAKLALYQTMLEQKISNVALAERLDMQEGAVRRMLHLGHRSHIDQIARALAELGQRIAVTVKKAA